MANKLSSIYLAGSIRDDVTKDISWRELVISSLEGFNVSILNPLGGKTYNPQTKEWLASGAVPTGRFIVKHDFWAVDHADIVIFNFAALAEGYPNIGTLIEFGRATSTKSLLYVIIPEAYKGHGNTKLFKLHPFIEENSALVFPDLATCIDFMQQHLHVLSGQLPRFKGN